jgi:hypothetical protein
MEWKAPMRISLATCVLVSLSAVTIAAQDKPDFSGNWILVNSTGSISDAAQTMTVRESFQRVSLRGTPIEPPFITLAVERHSTAGVRSDLYAIGVAGGTTGGVVGNRGVTVGDQTPETRFSTTWDGDALVIETGAWTADTGPQSSHKEVWSLDVQGTLLINVTDRSTGEPETATLVYRRVQ